MALKVHYKTFKSLIKPLLKVMKHHFYSCETPEDGTSTLDFLRKYVQFYSMMSYGIIHIQRILLTIDLL